MAEGTGFLKLGDVTPEMEDSLFHIDTAIPVERPILFILIGSPGAGKSSGHKYAQAFMGLGGGSGVPGYATIDLDLIVERMEPFRAASMLARILSRDPDLKARIGDINFPTMEAYISERQNLKMFDWFDDIVSRLGLNFEAIGEWGGDPFMNIMKQLYNIRRRWYALKDAESGKPALWKRTNLAIERAMTKRVNIVYETTMGPGKYGKKIAKFDALKALADRYDYNVHLYHIGCSDEAKHGLLIKEIQKRVEGRQEFDTPFREPKPFWRYVPPEGIAELVVKNATAYNNIRSYVPESPTMHFAEYCPIPFPERPFNLGRELNASMRAYSGAPISGGKRRKTRGRRRRHFTKRRR